MILSFRDPEAAAIFAGNRSKRFGNLQSVIERRLRMLNLATTLNDLASVRGNALEALHGNRQGQHSIRINDQYRLCFRWTPDGPADVEVTDYH
jgi:toxin HigB-1